MLPRVGYTNDWPPARRHLRHVDNHRVGRHLDPDADHVGRRPSPYPAPIDTITRRVPLGTFVHARSGDKGGDANLGLWIAHDGSEHREARVEWLSKLITPRRIAVTLREHATIVAAVAAGDSLAARAAMSAHLDSVIGELEDFAREHPALFDDD